MRLMLRGAIEAQSKWRKLWPSSTKIWEGKRERLIKSNEREGDGETDCKLKMEFEKYRHKMTCSSRSGGQMSLDIANTTKNYVELRETTLWQWFQQRWALTEMNAMEMVLHILVSAWESSDRFLKEKERQSVRRDELARELTRSNGAKEKI